MLYSRWQDYLCNATVPSMEGWVILREPLSIPVTVGNGSEDVV